jgi:thiol-disulfide isomerase/thioredoxin
MGNWQHGAFRGCAAAFFLLLAGCEIGTETLPRDSSGSSAPAQPDGALVDVRPASTPLRLAPSASILPETNAPAEANSGADAWRAGSSAAAGAAKPEAPASPASTSRAARGRLQFIDGFAKGFAAASRSSKPMLLFFTAEWCHYCHQMADEALSNPQVVRLSEHFVCVLVDADREAEVCKQFKISGYPTIQFLSPRGVPLQRLVGKKPGHQVMMSMQSALQTNARQNVAARPTP